MGRIAVFLSNKGGSGRSTAAANVGVQVASAGYSVCLVDLDLRSATLGAVLGLPRMENGIDAATRYPSGPSLGVLDLLGADVLREDAAGSRQRTAPPPFLATRHDAWRAPGRRRPPLAGDLWLVPGNARDERLAWHEALAQRLRTMIEVLRGAHDLTIIDLRAGKHDMLRALIEAGRTSPADSIDLWLVFHRWTHQHVYAASALAEHLALLHRGRPTGPPILLVRTADGATTQATDRDLAVLSTRRLHAFPLFRPTIPFSPTLQQRETILRPRGDAADEGTVDAFRRLGAFLIETASAEHIA